MSSNQIVDEYKLKTDGFDKAKKQAKDFQKAGKATFKDIALGGLAAQAAFAGLAKVAGSLLGTMKESVAAGIEYTRTVEAQRRALVQANIPLKGNLDLLIRQSGEIQKLAGVSDETVREMQTLALNFGVSVEKVDDYVRAAIRMSKVTGGDMKTAIGQLVKVEQGLIDRTLKVIPGITELTKEQLKAGDAINLVNDAWRENLLIQDNMEGRLTAVKLSWDDLKEAIGLGITENDTVLWALSALNTQLEITTRHIQNMPSLAEHAKSAIEGLAAAGAILLPGGAGVAALAGFYDPEKPAGDPAGLPRSEGRQVGSHTVTTTEEGPTKKKRTDVKGIAISNLLIGEVDPSISFTGDDLLQAMADGSDQVATIQNQNLEQRALAEQLYAQGIADLRTAGAEHHASIEEKKTAETVKAAQERSQADQAAFSIAMMSAEAVEGAIKAIASGSVEAAVSYFSNLAKSIGSTLIAYGLSAEAQGAINSANPYAPGSGAGQIATGTAAIAIGSALFGAGVAGNIGVAISGATGGGSAPGASVAGGTGGAGAAPERNATGDEGSSRPVVVNVNSIGKLGHREIVILDRELNKAIGRGYH